MVSGLCSAHYYAIIEVSKRADSWGLLTIIQPAPTYKMPVNKSRKKPALEANINLTRAVKTHSFPDTFALGLRARLGKERERTPEEEEEANDKTVAEMLSNEWH